MSEGAPKIAKTIQEKQPTPQEKRPQKLSANLEQIAKLLQDGNLDPTEQQQLSEVLLNFAEHARVMEANQTIDTMTGWHNRQGFDEELTRRINSHQRGVETGPLTLVHFDLDGFSNINNTYGHPAGDEYLKSVAAEVAKAMRKTDFLARRGGDEFAVVLQGTSLKDAAVATEHIQQAVIEGSRKAKEALRKKGYDIPEEQGNVTASIGYDEYDPARHPKPEDIDNSADYALYVVKAAGKKGYLSYAETSEYDADGALREKHLHEGNRLSE